MGQRVLINVMLFGPGGGATHLLHLCSALVKQGAEVTLVSRYADRRTPVVRLHKSIPVRFITTPFSQNRSLYRLSTAWALLIWPYLLRGKKYDVLYTWELSSFTRFLSRYLGPGGRVLLQRIGEPIARDAFLDPALEKLLHGAVVETSVHVAALRRVMKRSIPIWALPVMGHCESVPTRNGHRPHGKLQLTFLGRYHRDKGIFRLLEIWPGLNIGNAELTFYGWGPEREELRRRVNELGLENQIHLHGAYSTPAELSAIMARTDLVVLPSHTEGLPLVLLEAMAHGVPFVATDVGATRVLADDNPDVKVVPLDNEALRKAIDAMAREIRVGSIRSDRLQSYYQARYGHEKLTRQWLEVLLQTDQVFK